MSHPVRGPLLHARSRGLYPAGAALLVLAVAAPLTARAFAGAAGGSAAVLRVLAVTAGVALVGPGLTGADPDLEAGTPRSRPPLRLAHLGIAALAVTAALTAGQLLAHPSSGAGSWDDLRVIGRDVAGLLGLQVVTAALAGARLCWIPPTFWVLVMLAAGGGEHGWKLVLSMPMSPPGTTVAAVTAVSLLAVGAAVHATVRVTR